MRRRLLLATVVLAGAAGCLNDAEGRGREAAEKIRSSIPDVEATALRQDVSPDVVRRAQEALLATREYLGEVNGELDSVTVNAIEAFQAAHGLTADGILDARTRRELDTARLKSERAPS